MAEPVSAQLVDQLRQLLKAVGYNSMGEIVAYVHETELSTSQLVAVLLVHKLGPQSISKLASKLGLSLSATSHLLDQLVRRDMLEREEDADDRRQKILHLAPAGEAVLDRLLRARLRSIEDSLRQLPGPLQHELISLLTRVLPFIIDKPCSDAPQDAEPLS